MRTQRYLPKVESLFETIINELPPILGDNLVGIYVTGSLSYGAYKPDSSDVDLVVVIKRALDDSEVTTIESWHKKLEANQPDFANRIECSYVPIDWLSLILPPPKPRPYMGGGEFWRESTYGNEWLINNYWLYKCGETLWGPSFRTLMQPVSIEAVKKAVARDLEVEWMPKIEDPSYLENPHHQAYLVLNLCRIAYTLKRNDLASKLKSAIWVGQTYSQWKGLINEALEWTYGKEMNRNQEVIMLIKFVVGLKN